MLVRNDAEVGARLLISNELAMARRQLREANDEYQELVARVTEVAGGVQRLKFKIEQLERDEKALTRGYVALMGDVASR